VPPRAAPDCQEPLPLRGTGPGRDLHEALGPGQRALHGALRSSRRPTILSGSLAMVHQATIAPGFRKGEQPAACDAVGAHGDQLRQHFDESGPRLVSEMDRAEYLGQAAQLCGAAARRVMAILRLKKWAYQSKR
jgi:hypothetical protein